MGETTTLFLSLLVDHLQMLTTTSALPLPIPPTPTTTPHKLHQISGIYIRTAIVSPVLLLRNYRPGIMLGLIVAESLLVYVLVLSWVAGIRGTQYSICCLQLYGFYL